MSHILPLMYHHKASFPHSKCVDVHEQKEMFATSGPVDQSNHARPFISTWATRLVALEARKQVGRATKDDPNDPDTQTRFRAHSNDRTNAKIQVGAIASFIISRNRYANADLAMALGVWHFACKSHIDVKRNQECDGKRTTEGCLLLDNVQQYCDVHEQGIGRQSQLKVGTAGTWVELEDCAPGPSMPNHTTPKSLSKNEKSDDRRPL
ncbi:hypothetical protein B0H13DRAFT_1928946 [Mycena leptocephala]|nr:hypothetical protein B0H13DRAFT_1928946 [Mycena leptocephala]